MSYIGRADNKKILYIPLVKDIKNCLKAKVSCILVSVVDLRVTLDNKPNVDSKISTRL